MCSLGLRILDAQMLLAREKTAQLLPVNQNELIHKQMFTSHWVVYSDKWEEDKFKDRSVLVFMYIHSHTTIHTESLGISWSKSI